jgi:hypothetical protein
MTIEEIDNEIADATKAADRAWEETNALEVPYKKALSNWSELHHHVLDLQSKRKHFVEFEKGASK